MQKHQFEGEKITSTTPCKVCGALYEERELLPCVPKNAAKIINVTPHSIRFKGHGTLADVIYEIPPCGVLINARPEEESAGNHPSGAWLVKTRFVADPESEKELVRLEKENPGAVIVGSIIAAQAFPGRVFAMVPVTGFERVPPAEKIMRDDKFTTF